MSIINQSFVHLQLDVQFGLDVTVVEPCNLYECKIMLHLLVHSLSQSNTKIGKNARQSHSFICSHVTIGNNCFIGMSYLRMIYSKGFPSTDEKDWLPTIIENNVSIGSGVTILPVKIAMGCVIGAGSVVTKSLKVKGIYAGNPAKLIRKL